MLGKRQESRVWSVECRVLVSHRVLDWDKITYRNFALTVRDGRTARRGRRCRLRYSRDSLLGGLQRDEWIVKDEIQLAIR